MDQLSRVKILEVVLNGEARAMVEETSVLSLLQEVGLNPDRVAIEINLQIIERSHYAGTFLREGDQVEIIGFVGGGIRS